jgi:hypothetical protein
MIRLRAWCLVACLLLPPFFLGCAHSASTDGVLLPRDVLGCYLLEWSSRPPEWVGAPLVDTLRIGPEGVAAKGVDATRSLDDITLEYDWAIWRIISDTLAVYRPGDGLSIGLNLLATTDGFSGEWLLGTRPYEPLRGKVTFRRFPCN